MSCQVMKFNFTIKEDLSEWDLRIWVLVNNIHCLDGILYNVTLKIIATTYSQSVVSLKSDRLQRKREGQTIFGIHKIHTYKPYLLTQRTS